MSEFKFFPSQPRTEYAAVFEGEVDTVVSSDTIRAELCRITGNKEMFVSFESIDGAMICMKLTQFMDIVQDMAKVLQKEGLN